MKKCNFDFLSLFFGFTCMEKKKKFSGFPGFHLVSGVSGESGVCMGDSISYFYFIVESCTLLESIFQQTLNFKETSVWL